MSITLREEVRWFAELMELALQRKDEHYGGNSWSNCSVEELIIFLEEHVLKLKKRQLPGRDAQQLIHDATDVGNFAMMIADLAVALKKNDILTGELTEGTTGRGFYNPPPMGWGKKSDNEGLKPLKKEDDEKMADFSEKHGYGPKDVQTWSFEEEQLQIKKEQEYMDKLRDMCKPSAESNIDEYLKPQPWHLSDEEFEAMTGAKYTIANEKEATPFTEKEIAILKAGGFDLDPLDDDCFTSYMQELCANSFTTSSVALLMDTDEERVNFYRSEKLLYAFFWENCWFFPKVQFDGNRPLPKLDLILEVVRPEVHPLAFMGWLQNPDPDLYLTDEEDKPMSPLQWLRRGGPIKGLRALAKEL